MIELYRGVAYPSVVRPVDADLAPASKIIAVTFDATGTLFAAPRLADIYAEVLGRHGIVVPLETLSKLIPVVWKELACAAPPFADRFSAGGGNAREFWRRFLLRTAALASAPEPSRFAAAELYERFARPEAWEVFPDVEPVLAALGARGLKLGVVSNWDERLPVLLDRLGIASHFEVVVVSAVVGREKPHPEPFHLAVRALAATPATTLHVGDSRRDDLEGAEGAGLRALLLARRDGRGDISSLADLPATLDRLDEEAERKRFLASSPERV